MQNVERAGDKGAHCAQLMRVAMRMERLKVFKPVMPKVEINDSRSQLGKHNNAQPVSQMERCFPNRHSRQSINQALSEYNLPAAAVAMAGVKTPRWVFTKQLEDQLAAMLVLNDDAALKDWHRSGAFQRAMVRVSPEIKSYLKAFSYTSVKPGRNAQINLNGRVRSQHDRPPAVCLDLAVFWLLDRKPLESGKICYAEMATKRNLQLALSKRPSIAISDRLAFWDRHLIENTSLGIFIAAQFRKLDKGDPASEAVTGFMITSDCHSMACRLKIKAAEDGTQQYVIHFYDPNVTATHRRMRSDDLSRIEAISMTELINDPARTASYYRDQSLSTVYAMPHAAASSQPRQIIPIARSDPLSQQELGQNTAHPAAMHQDTLETPPLSANYMWHVLVNSLIDKFPAAFGAVARIPDAKRQYHLLAAVSSKGGAAFAYVLEAGDTRGVTAFTRCVLASEILSSNQKTQLLSPRRADGILGISKALKNRRMETVTAFRTLVLESNALSQNQKHSICNDRGDGRWRLSIRSAAFRTQALITCNLALARSCLNPT